MKTTDLKKIIDLFSPINDAISIIEKVATLEQAENEAKIRIEKLRKEADGVAAKCKAEQDKADNLLEETKAQARLLAEAADAEMASTKEAIAGKLQAAQAKAKAIITDAEAKVIAMEAKAAEAARKAVIANAELIDLETKIAKAQAQIAKLLGGN